MDSAKDTLSGGLPHSEIPGSTIARISPGLFAACHVLHRLSVPRHPPDALLFALEHHTKRQGRRSEVGDQRSDNQSPCSVRHSRDPPPMRQFSPLEDTSDTHRAHGSTRPRHTRASSRAPQPNISRDRKACPPRSQLASSPFNQQTRPEPVRGA
jgi:hypothetical protein